MGELEWEIMIRGNRNAERLGNTGLRNSDSGSWGSVGLSFFLVYLYLLLQRLSWVG